MADVEGSSGDVAGQEGGKRSAWMRHVKKTMRSHKGMKLGAVLKMASKTFKKSKRGGGGLTPASLASGDGPSVPSGTAPVSGGRRRGSRKSRRGGRRRGSRKGGNIECEDWKAQGFASKADCIEASR